MQNGGSVAGKLRVVRRPVQAARRDRSDTHERRVELFSTNSVERVSTARPGERTHARRDAQPTVSGRSPVKIDEDNRGKVAVGVRTQRKPTRPHFTSPQEASQKPPACTAAEGSLDSKTPNPNSIWLCSSSSFESESCLPAPRVSPCHCEYCSTFAPASRKAFRACHERCGVSCR